MKSLDHSADAAHPRWRGEHQSHKGATYRIHGSSPLARGALNDLFCLIDSTRLIPAGAGSTLSELWFFEPLGQFYFSLFSPPPTGLANDHRRFTSSAHYSIRAASSKLPGCWGA